MSKEEKVRDSLAELKKQYAIATAEQKSLIATLEYFDVRQKYDPESIDESDREFRRITENRINKNKEFLSFAGMVVKFSDELGIGNPKGK